MKYLSLILLGATVTMVSCSEEETPDTQRPVITVLNPASDHLDKEPGDTLNLSALFTDDVDLLNGKIDIHLAGDHTHRVSSGWEWAKVYPISGKEFTISEVVAIPASADTGKYHVTFEGTDKAGNIATPVVVELHLD